MSNINASAYIRLPFVVNDPALVALLTLRMRYDDGFVAFINGSEVARVNAPLTPVYNSSATNNHSAISAEQFRVGPGTLQAGTNILAIQGLNLSAADADFLVQAELVAANITGASSTPVYFTQPTPGAPNSSGVAAPGDFAPTSGPAGSYGGNLDYNEIGEGATVILPVYHPGGLLFIGDGHALQADGEPTGTGIETSMEVEFSSPKRRVRTLTSSGLGSL